jgi:predicted nuclease of restriction endonuclease-like RecB superfamily
LKQRVAIPDFYLSESNTIVEIKSNWTYDEQNMKDKFKVYKEHGYNFKLILEGKEVDFSLVSRH